MAVLQLLFLLRCVLCSWDFKPAFVSEMAAPELRIVEPLLAEVCPYGAGSWQTGGQRETGCLMTPQKASSPGNFGPETLVPGWQADGVIFGHFFSPTSDDAVVSGGGQETHPALWGGTLLLTRTAGRWKPLWYKPAVITRHCRRLATGSGRQILFCQDRDGGMGHEFDLFFTVDLTEPRNVWESTVFATDNFESLLLGGVQIQRLDRVEFLPGSGVRITARHGRVDLALEDGPKLERTGWPRPQLRRYRVELEMRDGKLVPTPQSASAAKLFRGN